MKRVRFLTPVRKSTLTAMNDSDCHSPRPFIERHLDGTASELPSISAREILYSPDPMKRFECSDSSPYPILDKTYLSPACDTGNQWTPCSDLELSILDSNLQPRKPVYFTPVGNLPVNQNKNNSSQNVQHLNFISESSINVLSPVDNTKTVAPPNILNKDDDFFITRGGLKKFQLHGSLEVQMNKLSLGKENNCKQIGVPIARATKPAEYQSNCYLESSNCRCHHCVKILGNFNTSTPGMLYVQNANTREDLQNCIKQPMFQARFNHCECIQTRHINTPQHCCTHGLPQKHESEQTNNKCTQVEKQMNVSKEKREPTVGDLLKIIKLQNEQLQLLQEKVDKLISTNICGPMQNFVTERVALETIDHDKHKISIGVMTSLEMVRTSTIINKEQVVQQTHDNAQVQCNTSEISIKEVKQPVNLNFLDGILPVGKTANPQTSIHESLNQHVSNLYEEKTLNELSLYNVQVDNAITPLMSPEQSLYLDVRDYSGSDSGSDHSNVGWTYYNKVMTHVNGMLQNSDMPSSASALYRNTRQHCLQMQIDKTNISVTKRVTFGDDAQVIHQPQLCTDTSMKMNQLAAKYLKSAPSAPAPAPAARQSEMSFATRNYMERHKLIQGTFSKSLPTGEMPRFLDITTLKQQPKLL